MCLILLTGFILRIYKIEQAFPFDFDQQIPAEAAYNFFINHKITLIGQELSFKGFFLGSLHNWIQFIPYGICNLKPPDHCVSYTKRFAGGRIENDFHIIVSFPDNNESIRAYIGFISYLRETKKMPIECPSPNELFGE